MSSSNECIATFKLRESLVDECEKVLNTLKKQGYKQETFYKFAEERGISEADKIISRKDFLKVLDNFQKLVNKK